MGKNSNDVFDYYSDLKVILALHLEGPDIGVDINKLVTKVIKLSLNYFCILFQGIFEFLEIVSLECSI